jgi:hypothetical protein
LLAQIALVGFSAQKAPLQSASATLFSKLFSGEIVKERKSSSAKSKND